MMYDLPTSVEVNGHEYAIRSDYRAILDIIKALTDPELKDEEKAQVVMGIFYLDDIPLEEWEEAIKKCFWFVDCGEETKNRATRKLMDWEQDFKNIVAPINRVLGTEIRALEYLHWWTFVSAYYEMGDCLFAQIVRIRQMKAKGKPLDKFDKEWYRDHRDLVDLKRTYTEAEDALLAQWGIK